MGTLNAQSDEMKKIVVSVERLLHDLGDRISAISDEISYRIGTIELLNGLQPFVSFLKSVDSHNIDLCVIYSERSKRGHYFSGFS